MALVAYGSSDESENEEDESVTEKQITIDVTTNSKSKEASQQFVVQDKDTGGNNAYIFCLSVFKQCYTFLDVENTLFTKLPQPKQTSDIIEEAQDEFLLKKETTVEKPKPPKQKIIIGIPSLSQFDSDDEGEGEKVARKQPAVSHTNCKTFFLFALFLFCCRKHQVCSQYFLHLKVFHYQTSLSYPMF